MCVHQYYNVCNSSVWSAVKHFSVLSFVPYFRRYYLLDFCLEMPQLDALFQMSPVLLCRQVQLLLLLVEELQQVLHSCGHVHISVAQQLHTCPATFYYQSATIFFLRISEIFSVQPVQKSAGSVFYATEAQRHLFLVIW